MIPHPHVSLSLGACKHPLFNLIAKSEDPQNAGFYAQLVIFKKDPSDAYIHTAWQFIADGGF